MDRAALLSFSIICRRPSQAYAIKGELPAEHVFVLALLRAPGAGLRRLDLVGSHSHQI